MIIFVGDRPSPKMKPGARPFEGAACEQRLMEWIKFLAGNSPRIVFNSDELYKDYPQIGRLYNGPIIALGNSASKCLKACGYKHFKLPHPSGRNRQINDKEFIAKKLKECKNWLRGQNV